MKAKLFSVTTPLPILHADSQTVAARLTPESSIVYMARVSSPNQTDNDPEKLLRYLIKHGHWSPFDMVDVVMEIETSRAIMAQILRHWSFRFQEFSQRYSEVVANSDGSHFEDYEMRSKADGGNRQGSGDTDEYMTLDSVIAMNQSLDCYNDLMKAGIAPECARMVLPLATKTRAYMKGSVRSWMTYFWQRLDSHAQKEHRELAEEMFTEFSGVFPVIASIVIQGRPGYVEGAWIQQISRQ